MNKFVKFSFVMAMVFSASINATAQKTDIVASWQGVNTLREVGGNHAPYKALASIYIKNDLKQVRINKYSTNYQYHDGMLAISNGETGKWGFIDENGNLLPGGYKWYTPGIGKYPQFGAGYCIVGLPAASTGSVFKHYDYYILDKQGKTKKLAIKDLVTVYPFNNGGIAAVDVGGQRNKFIFFNTQGQQVFKNIVNAADDYPNGPLGDFNNGWARIKLGTGSTFVSQAGTMMPKKFVDAQDFSEGLAAVAVQTGNGVRWGFIDSNGQMVIEPKFSKEPTPFSNGYSVAKKTNDKMVFIDKQGNVRGTEAKWYTNFVNGYALGANYNEVWLVDQQMQRHSINGGLDHYAVENLAKKLPVKTAFNGRYIYYETNQWLIYPPTGTVYRMNGFVNGWNDKIDQIGDKRIHVNIKGQLTGNYPNKTWDGFLDDRGVLIFVFNEEEF